MAFTHNTRLGTPDIAIKSIAGQMAKPSELTVPEAWSDENNYMRQGRLLETYTELKEMAENPLFQQQRQEILTNLSDKLFDLPMVKIVSAFNTLPYCFTLQSCYGHFVYNGQTDPQNLKPLPVTEPISQVEYRIAYIAFCLDNSEPGRELLGKLAEIAASEPENIQLCCAEWFWEKQVNSYVLQVEPDRFKNKDRATLGYHEALYVESLRNEFFARLNSFVCKVGE